MHKTRGKSILELAHEKRRSPRGFRKHKKYIVIKVGVS